MRTRSLSAALVFLVLLPSTLHAQQRWAVIAASASPDHLPRAMEVAQLASPPLEATGAVVLSQERAIAIVENTVSRPFRAAPPELLARLGRVREQALEHVAFGRDQRTIDVAEGMLAELAPHLSSIGRNEQAARDTANLCLFAVRAYLHKRDRGGAEALALTCLRYVPNLSPDASLNPPETIALVQQARAILDRGEHGILSIQALPTDPDGCAVRVNGRVVGQTPSVRLATTPGAYEVQVECSEARIGRVHPVQVAGGEPTRVLVAVQLAQALESRPQVALSYRDREDLETLLPGDVAAVARSLSVERVLVAAHDGRQVALRAFELTETGIAQPIGAATVPEPVDSAASRSAVELALAPPQDEVEETSPEAARETAIAEGDSSESAPAAVHGPDTGLMIAGGSLVVIGGLGLGLSWYGWSELDARGRSLSSSQSPDSLVQAQRQFDELSAVPWAVGAGASALAIAGLPLLLPTEPEVPWWSYLVGVAGVGLAVGGAALLAIPGDCYVNTQLGETCARRTPYEVAGAILLETAAPFLTVPLIHAIGAATSQGESRGAAVTIRVRGEGGLDASVSSTF